MYYAQIDEKGRVHTVCELAGIIESPNVIPIETWDESLLGKYYDPASKQFQDVTVTADKTTIAADGVDEKKEQGKLTLEDVDEKLDVIIEILQDLMLSE